MEIPGTINVIGEDKGLEISRAIIKTHEYCLMNLDLLNDRERGYMFNEYFPAVKDYLIIEPDVLVPMGTPDTEPFKSVVCDAGVAEVEKMAKRKTLTDQFKFVRDDGQPDSVELSTLPQVIISVRVAKNKEADTRGHSWTLEPIQCWESNLTTGKIEFMEDVNTIEIMNYLEVKSDFYIFVDYVGINAAYEVGTDGEN
ncbi:MAG: hypothetical protein V3U75_06400 [Methylococcaceae bacterium]